MTSTEKPANDAGAANESPIKALEIINRLMQEKLTGVEICKRLGKTSPWLYMHLRLNNLHPSLKAQMERSIPLRERLSIHVGSWIGRLSDQDKQLEIWGVVRQERNLDKRFRKTKVLVDAILAQKPELGRKKGLGKQKEFDRGINKILRGLEILIAMKADDLADLQGLDDPNGPIKVINQIIHDLENFKPVIYKARIKLNERKKQAWSQEHQPQ